MVAVDAKNAFGEWKITSSRRKNISWRPWTMFWVCKTFFNIIQLRSKKNWGHATFQSWENSGKVKNFGFLRFQSQISRSPSMQKTLSESENQLQVAVENFQEDLETRSGYVKHSLISGQHSALWIRGIRRLEINLWCQTSKISKYPLPEWDFEISAFINVD